jgi:hypothetical protein
VLDTQQRRGCMHGSDIRRIGTMMSFSISPIHDSIVPRIHSSEEKPSFEISIVDATSGDSLLLCSQANSRAQGTFRDRWGYPFLFSGHSHRVIHIRRPVVWGRARVDD